MLNFVRDLKIYDIISKNERERACGLYVSGAVIADGYCSNIDFLADELREELYYDTIDEMIEDFSTVEHYSDEVVITLGDITITLELADELGTDDIDPNTDTYVDDMLCGIYGIH